MWRNTQERTFIMDEFFSAATPLADDVVNRRR